MARTRAIRKRMVAVRTIRRITKAMQMIATAKFTASLHRARATAPYSQKIHRLVLEVAAAAGDVSHPLIDGPTESPGRELLLAITSDRGMCGAYNANVLRAAMDQLASLRRRSVEFDLETSGKKAMRFFRFQGVAVAQAHSIGDRPDYDQVEPIGRRFIEAFRSGRYDAVRVAYMRFESNTRQVPKVLTLLPLKPEAAAAEAAGPQAVYEFSPSSEALLDDLLPLAVKVTLFQAFLDAAVSEQIMRMVAMKAATENTKELSKLLNRRFNRARQGQITTELMEVISGSVALE